MADTTEEIVIVENDVQQSEGAADEEGSPLPSKHNLNPASESTIVSMESEIVKSSDIASTDVLDDVVRTGDQSCGLDTAETSADVSSPDVDSGNDNAATDAENGETIGHNKNSPTAIVSSSKKSRPPYKYDPDKITLRFLFANRDGLCVTVECKPTDTVGEVKGALLSVWPEDLPIKIGDLGGDNLRLICMGKGYLMPDTRTLEDCQVPVFKTHPTPINVSVKPQANGSGDDDKSKKNKKDSNPDSILGGTGGSSSLSAGGTGGSSGVERTGCCTIL